MSILMPAEQTDNFELTPEGGFLCVCYRVVDLGTQTSDFNGEKSTKRKIQISWEIPGELMSDGRPFSVHKRYTLSSHEKSQLRKDLESWRGKKFTKEEFGTFDIGNVIGHPCLIQVVHSVGSDKTYANISAIMSVPKGTAKPELVNQPIYFSLSKFDQEVYDKLSDGMKETIAKSPEYQRIKQAVSGAVELEY